jgi:hypothetical protein
MHLGNKNDFRINDYSKKLAGGSGRRQCDEKPQTTNEKQYEV